MKANVKKLILKNLSTNNQLSLDDLKTKSRSLV